MRRARLTGLPHGLFLPALLACLGLAACTVGPDFIAPPGPDAKRFTPEKTASPGAGQRFVEGADVPAQRWTLFRSKPLNALVRESLAHNPSLEAAEAAIRVAYYNARAQKGGFFPQALLNAKESQNLESNNRSRGAINQSVFSQTYPSPANILANAPVPNVPTNTPNAPYGLFLK
jgi:outer membrane protein TolC